MATIEIGAIEIVEEMGRLDGKLVELAVERLRSRKLEALLEEAQGQLFEDVEPEED